MSVRKSVVVLQVGLILLALLFFNAYSRALDALRNADVITRYYARPQYLLILGILCVAGCMILLVFVTYDAPYRGAPASVQGRQRISAPSL